MLLNTPRLAGLPDNGVAECMATYVVEAAPSSKHGGLIKRITFVWRPRTDGVKL